MAMMDEIKWDDAYQEALGYFKALLRFETVNPPGNEKPAAQYLAEVLSKDGIEPELFDSAENRSNLVCRLKGSGEKPPILLNGHLDVVPVELEKWTMPPFEAQEKDGCLYGRGALDMKNMVAMSLMAVLLMKRAGAKLKRDIIFCAVSDEEAGGRYGSQFMVENHADKVKAEYSISEAGGFSMEMEGKRFYLIQVAEKGLAWLKIRTQGEPGHGSIPNPDSALIKAAAIAATLGKKRLPQHNVPPVVHFAETIASQLKFPKNAVFKLLLNPALSGLIIDKVMPDKRAGQAFAAMLHNTANPTVIRAGEKTNVIPSQAELEVDGRILPGFTTADFISEVRALIGDGPEIEVMRELTPTQAPADDPIMTMIREVILRHDPGSIVLPYLLTGFSDATHWKKLGLKCYGFSPVKLPADLSLQKLAHGHDERIPLDGFRFGLRALFELVEKVSM
ncbi:MAG TPA: M20/M25/M40 family metallo-hydrolase [bacterium]|nr:M20/M25/M40 family metallo-hydrolase [bacterium]